MSTTSTQVLPPETFIQIGDCKRVFQFFETNAPVAYDYGSTYTVYDYEDGRRIVMIDKEKVEYQKGRNASGLYSLIPMERHLRDHCENILYKRMFPSND